MSRPRSRPGTTESRDVARDLETGQAAVGKPTALSVPEEPDAGVRFSSPLLIVPGCEPHYVKLNWPGKAADAATLVDFYPFLPKNGSPLVGPLRAGEKAMPGRPGSQVRPGRRRRK